MHTAVILVVAEHRITIVFNSSDENAVFIAVIEDEFNITFTDDDLASEDVKVVGKMVNLVTKKMEDTSK